MDLQILKNLVEDAQEVNSDLPVLQRLVVTQGIHESNFLGKNGGSQLAIRYNNLFGMKARVDSNGMPLEPAVSLPTWEVVNGKEKHVNAYFRKFTDHAECFTAHRRLMQKPRYERVLKSLTIEDACKNVYLCGYATDPLYPKKLMAVYIQIVANAFKRYGK